MHTNTLRFTTAMHFLVAVALLSVAYGQTKPADLKTISVAALQGSNSSFNVPDGHGGTIPTGAWLVQQTGPGTWNWDASTGHDTFMVPLQASFPNLPGSPSIQLRLTETGIFQFMQQNESGILAENSSNIGLVHANLGGVALDAVISNTNTVTINPKPAPPLSPAAVFFLAPPPPGYMGFPIGTLPPNGEFPSFGTNGFYGFVGSVDVQGVPGAQLFTGTGSFDTAPLSSGSMTAANVFTTSGTGSLSVSQIDVAVGYVSGTNSFHVDIYTDTGGLPGSALASFTNLSSSTNFGTCCGLVTITEPGLMLSAGQQYWIVIGPTTTDSTTSEEWNLNSQDVIGSDVFSTDGGLTWTKRGQQTLGAFDILADSSVIFSDLGPPGNVYQCCFGLQVSGSGAGTDKSLVRRRK